MNLLPVNQDHDLLALLVWFYTVFNISCIEIVGTKNLFVTISQMYAKVIYFKFGNFREGVLIKPLSQICLLTPFAKIKFSRKLLNLQYRRQKWSMAGKEIMLIIAYIPRPHTIIKLFHGSLSGSEVLMKRSYHHVLTVKQ